METNGSLGMAGDRNFPDPVRDEPNFPVLVRDKEIDHCFLCVQLDCRRRISVYHELLRCRCKAACGLHMQYYLVLGRKGLLDLCRTREKTFMSKLAIKGRLDLL